MDLPPYYILVAHSAALVHADVEYRYADDSPLALLPRFPGEHVLVFNHDPDNPAKPTVSSTSSQLAPAGVKVLPAPGARIDEYANRNENMYIIEVASTDDSTSSGMESSQTYLQNPGAIIARFKQRNAELRRILEYPSGSNPQPNSPFS